MTLQHETSGAAIDERRAAGPEFPSDQDCSGRSFGTAELDLVATVLASGRLFGLNGPMTTALEDEFAAWTGSDHAIACSSGTSALHAAIATAGITPWHEVIVSPVTDIGGVIPVVSEQLIPVFADVDPVEGNLAPNSVEAVIGPRTRALVVTHLAGAPADMTAFAEIARRHDLLLFEDCAQAYGARHRGRLVGTFGQAGCFSIQQGKHISAGEGGLVVTDDPARAARMRSWINKGLAFGAAVEDHDILGMNARLTELQAAVALAQLRKLDGFIATRIDRAAELSAELRGVPGLGLPPCTPDDVHSFWKYVLRVDPAIHPGGRDALNAALRPWKALVSPRYVERPVYRNRLFAEHPRRLLDEPAAATMAVAAEDENSRYPGMLEFIDAVAVLQWNERLLPRHVSSLASGIRDFAQRPASR